MSKVIKKVAKAANQVAKMLSPEETALLQDIGAGIQQLLQLNAGEAQTAPGAPPEVEAAMHNEEEEEGVAAKSDDGVVANKPAEERVEDPTPITDDNLSKLGKALTMMVEEQGAPQVQMAAKGMDVQTIVTGVSKQLIPIVTKINVVEKAMEVLLDALGFADTIVEEAAPATAAVQTVAKAQGASTGMTPVINKDAQGFMDMLSTSIAKAMKEERIETAHELRYDANGLTKAREDLKGSMKFLLNKPTN